MAISEICNREVVVMQRQENILEAARLMRQHHVGDVVVVEQCRPLSKTKTWRLVKVLERAS